MHSMETRRKVERVVVHVVLIFFSIIMLIPFVWMLLTAFKSVSEATQRSEERRVGKECRL